jgi:DNA-binding transcriptional LysR family regulator
MDTDDRISNRLKVSDLRLLSAVVQSGGMAKAAAQLNVSQPAVSKAIAALERTLGVRLLDRNSRGVEPTPYGRAILRRGAAIFDELRQGVNDVKFLSDPTAGEVRIGSNPTSAETLLPLFIQPFCRQYPRVVLNIDLVPRVGPYMSGLRDRKYDLFIERSMVALTDDPLVADLKLEPLLHDQLVVVVGSNNRLARRRKINLAELADEPWILPKPNSWSYSALAGTFRDMGIDLPKARIIASSVPLRFYMLVEGPYITCAPLSSVQLRPNRHLLKILPVAMPVPPWPFAIFTLRNRTLSPVVERFIESARAIAKTLAIPSQLRKA